MLAALRELGRRGIEIPGAVTAAIYYHSQIGVSAANEAKRLGRLGRDVVKVEGLRKKMARVLDPHRGRPSQVLAELQATLHRQAALLEQLADAATAELEQLVPVTRHARQGARGGQPTKAYRRYSLANIEPNVHEAVIAATLILYDLDRAALPDLIDSVREQRRRMEKDTQPEIDP